MRKRLAAAAVAAISVSGILLASAPAALADQSACNSVPGFNVCQVLQSTADGDASATAEFNTATGYSDVEFDNITNYSMEAWVNIDYGYGYVTVWSSSMASDTVLDPGGFWDRGYYTQGCFQFTSWSGAAVHCTGGV